VAAPDKWSLGIDPPWYARLIGSGTMLVISFPLRNFFAERLNGAQAWWATFLVVGIIGMALIYGITKYIGPPKVARSGAKGPKPHKRVTVTRRKKK
jgi:hypothetical protein